ncbi:MAG TPA: glycoside hydrolase family 2 TIM barrel-domain containing protein, partial [Jatrophihabitans sp.]|nr:glycoside hydrolase family 2 TIM barrel-domain containing protein [Jatrophihabitans sp.]
SASYLEDQDMWWLSGIFRDVALLARPPAAIDDVFVHADCDHVRGAGTLRVDAPVECRVRCAELGIDATSGVDLDVSDVQPWTAETPRLYECTVSTADETVTVRIGFRRVDIVDGVLQVNGRPILFRGVNRHEWHPDRGRVMDADTMRADVLLMKRHNINAVRTSHYPPHPDFLDLSDEHGLWVVLENDLETHGFERVGWRNNPSDDPRWRAACLDRMQRTVERDKNHPSVVLWSLGNESGHGANLAAMADWAHGRDPSRPVHYEGDWDSGYVDVYSRMYATHAEVDAIGTRSEPDTVDPALDAHRRSIPFMQCEFGHAMGNGPGGLTEYQELFERYPRIAGGFVWEWIDQGIRQRTPDGREFFGYGGDFGEPLHDGNFVMDGLLFADRTPSPGLVEFATVIAPVQFSFSNSEIEVCNLRDFADLADLRFEWTVEEVGDARAGGELAVPPVAARTSVRVPLPALPETNGETWLTVRAVLAAPSAWADVGHEVAAGQQQTRPASVAPPARRRAPQRDAFGPDGVLTRIGPVPVSGPRLDLWRAPTDNDRGGYGVALAPKWRAMGLHRVTHRVVDQTWSDTELVVRTRVAAAATDRAMLATYTWTGTDNGMALHLAVEPQGEWPVALPRLGLRMAVPATLTAVEWFGAGPGEAYRDSRQAARVGRYSCSVDRLQTPYAVPQENGNRADVRWAQLTDPAGTGLLITGAPTFDLTVRPWTSEDLDAAAHPTDLRPRDALIVNLDISQNGLGTASCGPGVLPQHELRAEPAELVLQFSALGP